MDDMDAADLLLSKKRSNAAPAQTKSFAPGGLKKDSTPLKSPENPVGTGNSVLA